jgi:hypothetical protein
VSRAPARIPRAALAAVFLVAVLVRAVIGVWADGRGEMEGLAPRYAQDAYARVAGYGFVRPVEGVPPQVDFIALADSLGRHGKRLGPELVPAIDPARWRASTLHPPGYAAFLAAVYWAFGPPLIPRAKAIQVLLDAVACVALFFIARPVAGPRVGMISAWLAALFLPLAYLVTSRTADALVPSLLMATFGLWTEGLRSGRLRWFAAAGTVLGATCLLRPDWILLPVFLLVGALAVMRSRGRAVAASALLAVTAFLVVVPWGLRNQAAHGRFNVTSHAGGMALYQSIGQFPNPYGIIFDDDRMAHQVKAAGFESLDDPDADRWFKERFLAIARENPSLLAEQMARRIPLGIIPLYRWGYANPNYRGNGFYDFARVGVTPGEAIRRHPGRVLAAYWDRLVFGVAGLVLFVSSVALAADRRTRGWGLVLFLPYLYVFLSHLPVILGARLLLPAVFGQLIALAVWIERLVFHRAVEVPAP